MSLNFDFIDVERKLNDLSNISALKTVDRILQKGAVPVVKEMKRSMTNENLKDRTGTLKRSIENYKMKGKRGNRKATIGVLPSATNPIRHRKAILYGRVHEFGSKNHVARRWMTKGFNNAHDDARRIITQEIKKELRL